MNDDSIWPIRNDNGSVQVATHRYDHPDTDRVIWLTGMIHIADGAFYTELREYLCKQEADGVEIQYEMVGKGSDKDIMSLHPGEMLAIGLNRQYHRVLLCELADAADLSAQYLLNPPESWVNADITETDLVSLLGSRRALTQAKRVRLAARIVTHLPRPLRTPLGLLLRKAFLHLFPVGDIMEMAHEQDRRSPNGTSGVIVDRRNRKALECLLGSANPRVHATWGSGHVLGIHAGLLEAGFELTGQTWRTAIAKL